MSTLLVAAAVLVRNNRVLITQRKAGTHLAGRWEFPGGKVEADEDPRKGLERELHEELGVAAEVAEILEATFHRYSGAQGCREGERNVLLLFYRAHLRSGSPEPAPLDVAAVRWAAAEELREADFPAADIEILRKVRALLTDR